MDSGKEKTDTARAEHYRAHLGADNPSFISPHMPNIEIHTAKAAQQGQAQRVSALCRSERTHSHDCWQQKQRAAAFLSARVATMANF